MPQILREWFHLVVRNDRGQDLVEYALLAGFVAVAVGAVAPEMADSMTQIYSRVASKLVEANG